MIYKKQYGQPFDTESVVGSFLPMMETIPYLTKEPDGFSYAMDPQDILYGLGENIRGINKRGWVYESKCSDDGETKDYDKPEHFVHITLDADGNAKSDRATVKVEG